MNKTEQLFHQDIDETPESLRVEIDLSFAVADRIAVLLKKKSMSKEDPLGGTCES